MYQAHHTNFFYLFIVGFVASLIGWAVIAYYKPMIIEASCADIASKSNGLYKKRDVVETAYNFDTVRDQCVSDASETR
jgi:hypothetical protein